VKILIADDDPVSRRVLEGTLTRLGHEVVTVAEGRSAIHELLAPLGPTLAILDWMMPEVDGLAVCREVRRRPEPYVYVILLTARDRREDMVAALDAGADDFLTKPLDTVELRARLRSGERVLDLQAHLLETQAALRHQATHDYLTGLWNRRMILEELGREVNRASHNDVALSVAVADIDHFKSINDTHGHAAGDLVLQETGKRIRTVLRDYDAVGRLGGEEFLLLLPGCNKADGMEIADRARQAVAAEPIALPNGRVQVTLSLGVATRKPSAPADASTLVEAADAALYRAKANGRNRVEA
jgi:diguanylate cyclase (GGDEF)-like protein